MWFGAPQLRFRYCSLDKGSAFNSRGSPSPAFYIFFGLGSETYLLQCCGVFNVDVCP